MKILWSFENRAPGPYVADDIFKVMGSKVKVIDSIFQKYTFSQEVYVPIDTGSSWLKTNNILTMWIMVHL